MNLLDINWNLLRKPNESKKSLTNITDEDGIMNFLNDFESRNSDLKFELQMKRLWNKYRSRKMDEKNKSIEVRYSVNPTVWTVVSISN